MRNLIFALLLYFTSSFVLAASLGNEFDIEKADSLQVGVTTLEEAKGLFGSPVSTSTDSDGNQIIWWKYVKVNLFGKDVRKLSVVFDKEGKMTRIAHREAFK